MDIIGDCGKHELGSIKKSYSLPSFSKSICDLSKKIEGECTLDPINKLKVANDVVALVSLDTIPLTSKEQTFKIPIDQNKEFKVNDIGRNHHNSNIFSILAWITTIIYIGNVGIPIWITVNIIKMSETFARNALILPFGVIFTEDTRKPLPILLILQIIITILVGIFNLTFLLSWKGFTMKLVKFGVWIHFIFSIPVIPVVTAILIHKHTQLRERMLYGLYNDYFTWNITQYEDHCCGLDDFRDWEKSRTFLKSCYKDFQLKIYQDHQGIFIIDEDFIWNQGCYEMESRLIRISGIAFITSLGIGCILITIAICCIIHEHEYRFRTCPKRNKVSVDNL